MNHDRRIRRLRALADGYRVIAREGQAWQNRMEDVIDYCCELAKRKERARIVAKLRLAAENEPNARCSILDLADEIERGE